MIHYYYLSYYIFLRNLYLLLFFHRYYLKLNYEYLMWFLNSFLVIFYLIYSLYYLQKKCFPQIYFLELYFFLLKNNFGELLYEKLLMKINSLSSKNPNL